MTDGSPADSDETLSASSSSPRANKDGSKIVFITHADNFSGNHETTSFTQVAELDIKTGEVKFLFDADYYQSEPSYSNDGKFIVFRTESHNLGSLKNKLNPKGVRTSQIAEYDLTNQTTRYISDGDFWSDFPEYSPDGNKIIFQTRSAGFKGKFTARKNEWGDPEQQIAEWDRKTNVVTYITDGDGESSRPRYNHDGTKIIFVTGALNLSASPPNRRYQLAEYDVKNKKFTYLTNGDAGAANPVYSPDGKKVVFESSADYNSENPGGKGQIWELEVNSKKIIKIINGDESSSTPTYSANGNQIAFVTRADNFDGIHTKRSDDYGPVAQLAEWSRNTKKVKYLTDGDKPSLHPSYIGKSNSIIFATQADTFSGTHTQRFEYDMNRNEIPVFQIATIRR